MDPLFAEGGEAPIKSGTDLGAYFSVNDRASRRLVDNPVFGAL
jgi:hypothetical protein